MARLLVNAVRTLIFRGAATTPVAQRGFLLPIVIALGFGISTISIVALGSVAENSSELNKQYYETIAREAAQAGISAAATCIKSGDVSWTDSTPLTPATDCAGSNVSNKLSTIISEDFFDSSYTVKELEFPSASTAIVTSIGDVKIKGPNGATTQTFKQTVRTFANITATVLGRVSKDVVSLSTGGDTTCVAAEGSAYCWGDNGSGKLGLGHSITNNRVVYPTAVATNASPITPPPVVPSPCGGWFQPSCTPVAQPTQPASALAGKKVTKISVGTYHVCAVATDSDGTNGRAYCWGENSSGQLGNRSTTDSASPVAVDVMNTDYTPPPVVPSPCGGWFQPSCTPIPQPTQPKSALGNKTVIDISVGDNFSCALTSDGEVSCWGNNAYGQLGTNDRTSSSYPRAVYKSDAKPGVPAVTQIPSPCGGWFQPSCTPVVVTPAVAPQPATALWGKTVVKLGEVKSGSTICAIDTSDTAYCWGWNDVGQAGDNQHAPNSSSRTTGSSGPSGGNRASKCSGHTGSGSGSGTNGATENDYAALQPVALATTLKFSSISTVDNHYVTGVTSPSSANSKRAYWWGGTVNYSYSKSCSTRACGSNNSGNQWCASWSTTTTLTFTSNPPTGPLYNNGSGTTLNDKQISVASGNPYNGLFCALTGSDLYCDAHGGATSSGQTGSNYTPTCTTGWFGSVSCTSEPAGVRHVYQDGWLLGKTVNQMDTGANHTCVVTDDAVGCWGLNSSGQLGIGNTTSMNVPTPVDVTVNSDLGKEGGISSYTFDNPVNF